MMAGNVVSSRLALNLDENVPKGAAGNIPQSNLPRNPPENDGNRLKEPFKNLDLSGIELWTEHNSSQLETFCQSISIFVQ